MSNLVTGTQIAVYNDNSNSNNTNQFLVACDPLETNLYYFNSTNSGLWQHPIATLAAGRTMLNVGPYDQTNFRSMCADPLSGNSLIVFGTGGVFKILMSNGNQTQLLTPSQFSSLNAEGMGSNNVTYCTASGTKILLGSKDSSSFGIYTFDTTGLSLNKLFIPGVICGGVASAGTGLNGIVFAMLGEPYGVGIMNLNNYQFQFSGGSLLNTQLDGPALNGATMGNIQKLFVVPGGDITYVIDNNDHPRYIATGVVTTYEPLYSTQLILYLPLGNKFIELQGFYVYEYS